MVHSLAARAGVTTDEHRGIEPCEYRLTARAGAMDPAALQRSCAIAVDHWLFRCISPDESGSTLDNRRMVRYRAHVQIHLSTIHAVWSAMAWTALRDTFSIDIDREGRLTYSSVLSSVCQMLVHIIKLLIMSHDE